MAVPQPHFTRMKNVDYRYLEAVCLDQHRLAHFVSSGGHWGAVEKINSIYKVWQYQDIYWIISVLYLRVFIK